MLAFIKSHRGDERRAVHVFQVHGDGVDAGIGGKFFKIEFVSHTEREQRLEGRHKVGVDLRVVLLITLIKLRPALQAQRIRPVLDGFQAELIGKTDLVGRGFEFMFLVAFGSLKAEFHFQLVVELQFALVVEICLKHSVCQHGVILLAALIPVFRHVVLRELQRYVGFQRPEVGLLDYDVGVSNFWFVVLIGRLHVLCEFQFGRGLVFEFLANRFRIDALRRVDVCLHQPRRGHVGFCEQLRGGVEAVGHRRHNARVVHIKRTVSVKAECPARRQILQVAGNEYGEIIRICQRVGPVVAPVLELLLYMRQRVGIAQAQHANARNVVGSGIFLNCMLITIIMLLRRGG